jgi:hypothetical protein
VLGKAIEVLLLLGELLPQLDELFLFALADGVLLRGPLTALESVTAESQAVRQW